MGDRVTDTERGFLSPRGMALTSVFAAVLILIGGCGGDGPDASARSSATPTASSSTTPSERVSRAEFMIYASDVCAFLDQAPSYARDFSQSQTRQDKLIALRSLADTFDTTQARVAELSTENAPLALQREYKARVVRSVSQMESATKALLAEVQRNSPSEAAVEVDLRHLKHGLDVFNAYGRKYHLRGCHI